MGKGVFNYPPFWHQKLEQKSPLPFANQQLSLPLACAVPWLAHSSELLRCVMNTDWASVVVHTVEAAAAASKELSVPSWNHRKGTECVRGQSPWDHFRDYAGTWWGLDLSCGPSLWFRLRHVKHARSHYWLREVEPPCSQNARCWEATQENKGHGLSLR